jgi:dTDP-4-amino-4,6-dideoxygalactose transaminase
VTLLTIPANDFSAQWDEIRADALAAVDRVGRSGWLVLGSEVQEFEIEFAKWWGVSHVVGVASGLDALEIALRCIGISTGDRVLTTPLTAFATTLAVMRVGAEPVWADIDASGNIDLSAARLMLESDPSIRALLPVHLYGHPLDPDALNELAGLFDIAVVEDCAQSAGAERGGRPTGTSGRVAATSFYPTKNLGAYGDGGALLTNDAAVAERARILRDYGQDRRFHHIEPGLNSRLDEIQAAILRSALLPRLDRWLARREEVAARYINALGKSPLRPVQQAAGTSAHHLFPVEVVDGDPAAVREHLTAMGINLGHHYPVLCPDQPACTSLGKAAKDFPNAQRLAKHEISLPLNPQLDDTAVDRVVEICMTLPS